MTNPDTLYSIVLKLAPEREGRIRATHGHHAHAAFCARCARPTRRWPNGVWLPAGMRFGVAGLA